MFTYHKQTVVSVWGSWKESIREKILTELEILSSIFMVMKILSNLTGLVSCLSDVFVGLDKVDRHFPS